MDVTCDWILLKIGPGLRVSVAISGGLLRIATIVAVTRVVATSIAVEATTVAVVVAVTAVLSIGRKSPKEAAEGYAARSEACSRSRARVVPRRSSALWIAPATAIKSRARCEPRPSARFCCTAEE